MDKWKEIPGECESCNSRPECKKELAKGSLCGQRVKPTIDLGNIDGNAFCLIGTALKGLKKAGYSKEDMDKFKADATSGDYDHVLQVIFEWCEVE